ncbi:MAG: amidohydrolase [Myxococcota bacterium]|nr:amidohydrolase [bacterium]MDP6075352.1 amidohydrolase [Myxococcota bacterium]MDP6243020.1 amidohydrolase [Myxococcota bacterium]MDP7073972.1 amidohydrolase [Myxococcota bacterium]MDP7300234.1 amidohydrolase [Myxococcota bacterium]
MATSGSSARWIAGVWIGTQLWVAPAPAFDLVFTGGEILTMDEARPRAEALAVEDGRIAALGSEAELRARAGNAEFVDLEGGALLPGLIEPHCHPIGTAVLGQAADISGFRYDTRAQVMEALRDAVADAGSDEWVIAFGWDPVLVEDLEPPSLAELDALAPDQPLLILTQMMHVAYLNSAGYRAAGIDEDTPDPPGAGAFLRDAEGRLNGAIFETEALAEVLDAMPLPPEGGVDLLFSWQLADYARAGYTTLGITGPVSPGEDPIQSIEEVVADPTSPVRAFVYLHPEQLDPERTPVGTGGPRFAVKGVKFSMDGSPYAGGAAFSEPYRNTPLTLDRIGLGRDHRGEPNYGVEEFVGLITPFHEHGYQIAVHTQGEVAIDRALDAFEIVLREHPRADHRHRLEHNAAITPGQLARARTLGLTTSFFIDHVYFYGRALPELVGSPLAERFMPMAWALDAGHHVTLHTDNPATPIGPLRALRTAVTRVPRGASDPLGPDQRISVADGLRAMTIDAAWQLFEERERGSLEPGKAADLVWLSENPLDVDPAELAEIQVRGTWIDGRPADLSRWRLANVWLAARALWNTVVAKLFH